MSKWVKTRRLWINILVLCNYLNEYCNMYMPNSHGNEVYNFTMLLQSGWAIFLFCVTFFLSQIHLLVLRIKQIIFGFNAKTLILTVVTQKNKLRLLWFICHIDVTSHAHKQIFVKFDNFSLPHKNCHVPYLLFKVDVKCFVYILNSEICKNMILTESLTLFWFAICS